MPRKLKRVVLLPNPRRKDSVTCLVYRDYERDGILPGHRGTIMVEANYTYYVRWDGVGKLYFLGIKSGIYRELDLLEQMSEV